MVRDASRVNELTLEIDKEASEKSILMHNLLLFPFDMYNYNEEISASYPT